MEVAYILVPIFVFVLLKNLIEQRSKVRQERIRLLEKALENPAMDRPTLESLAFQLTGAPPPRQERRSGFLAFVLAIGWLALFVGIGVLVIGQITETEEATAGGALVSFIGFGLITYPFALRELEARQKA